MSSWIGDLARKRTYISQGRKTGTFPHEFHLFFYLFLDPLQVDQPQGICFFHIPPFLEGFILFF
ncbi:Hypothetical protein Minf_0521 [Methylacidiphilum infernorum V4]|uniref:Uncharacterized protein n=1 Tax=Methylacidiphilum infernorum (isolate V4) TaxID=481448 RepID=B3DZG2_METI4|nr:Hypothetical protein Minf_0521 [Methylacidiphilum infernorum V4]